MNDDGTVTVKLNNKKFGPYQFISQMHTWPDKSGFVAIVMDKEMKSRLVSSEGLNMDLNGDVEQLQFSPKSKKFVFALKERDAVDMDLMKIDFSKMTQEEMMAFAKKQEEKAKNAPERKSYVYVNGTTKFGPYNLNSFYSNNPGFIRNSDNWIMTIGNTLYINGSKTREFTDVDLNTCKIWLSGDAKRFVIVSYDKVVFSDGKTYNNPLEPSTTEKDGKLILKWLSLENEKDLVFYSREL
jgi:Tol biopolymer transport system component